MKKILLFLAMNVLVFSAFSQETEADKLFDKYSSGKNVTSIVISKYMVNMFSNIDTDDDDFDKMISGLTGIKLLTGTAEESQENFYKIILQKLPKSGYKELMYIAEDGTKLKFFVHETNKKVDELLLVGTGEKAGDNVFIVIQGIIDLKTIHKIAKVNGLEKLENIEKKKD